MTSGAPRAPFPAPSGPPASGRTSTPSRTPRSLRRAVTFPRRDDGRIVAGVAGGFADEYGVDPTLVRVLLVVLSLAAGTGLVLYALGIVLASEPTTSRPPRPTDPQRTLSVACVATGIVLLVRSTGLWLGDAVMVPLVAVAAGVVVLGLVRPDRPATPGVAANANGSAAVVEFTSGRRARARLFAGAALVSFGLLVVGVREDASNSLRIGAFATALTVIGVAVLVGPWLARLAQEAAAERRERIRVEEREAMAAHLHDSVLQTLALIQRTADDPRRTVTLARQQERELREWLYGQGVARRTAGGVGPVGLAAALRGAVQDVESTYDVRIEAVVVGDAPLDPAMDALVAAAREACVNAAKHSGTDEISLYAEVRGTAAEVFVRDRGNGFDRAAVAPDRRGIAQSIEARLERVGGSARVETAAGEGTEWQLSVPVAAVPTAPSTAPPARRSEVP